MSESTELSYPACIPNNICGTMSNIQEMPKSASSTTCPLILHSNLKTCGFIDYLGNGFKIRTSSSTPQDSVILPSCGIAILVVNLSRVSIENFQDTTQKTGDFEDLQVTKNKMNNVDGKENVKIEEETFETIEKLILRIQSFTKGHRISVVLLVGWVFAQESLGGKVMDHLQKELLQSNPLILPAHGDAQIAMHIQILSKVCQSEMRGIVQGRVEQMISSNIRKEQNVVIGQAMGLNYHESSILMDAFGSVAGVAAASATDIHQQTPLNAASAAKVAAFLAQDTVTF